MHEGVFFCLPTNESPCPAGTLLACEDVGALGLRDTENTKQALCVWKTKRCFYSFFFSLDERNDVMEGTYLLGNLHRT